MTTLKQVMNLVDAYGSERCSGNEYDNRYAEKRARDAVVSALKEYAPQRTWVGLNVFEINDLVQSTPYEDYHLLVEETEALLKEKNNGS